jgi:diadenosine tetraphosphate (Ap4A) HIT family hydrolase
MSQKSCIFCEIPEQKTPNQLIHKFDHCYAIYDQFPVSKGHVLLIPYSHIEDWFAASAHVQLDMMQALNSMKAFLDQKFDPDGYNIGTNCGSVAGQTVFHLHMHLIPRYTGDMEDPRGGVRGVIPHKQKYHGD